MEEEVKDLDKVMESSWRIAREISESEYIWDCERVGKMEIVNNGNSVE